MTPTQSSLQEERDLAVDALRKVVKSLHVLKAYLKAPDDEQAQANHAAIADVVNDGYDHGISTLNALGVDLWRS